MNILKRTFFLTISFLHLSLAQYGSQVGSVSWGYQNLAVFVTQATNRDIWYILYDGSVWSPWQSVGGWAYSGPSTCSWSWGRLDTFVIGSDYKTLYRIWYDYTRNGPIMFPWQWWGCCFYSGVACASSGFGKMAVYGIGSDFQMYTLDSQGGALSPLGFPPCGNFTLDTPGALWILERIYIFGRGNDNYLYYRSWCNNTWDNNWTQTDMVANSGPAVISWDPTMIHVFYRGANNELFHKSCMVGQTWGDEPKNLGGNITSAPSVSAWAYGRLDVFAKGADNHLWWISYDQCNGGWSQWKQMGDFLVL